MSQNLDVEFVRFPIMGKLEIIAYEFYNDTVNETFYQVKIEDPDEPELGYSELNLVFNCE